MASGSCAALTVTVRAVSQFAVVNVSAPGHRHVRVATAARRRHRHAPRRLRVQHHRVGAVVALVNVQVGLRHRHAPRVVVLQRQGHVRGPGCAHRVARRALHLDRLVRRIHVVVDAGDRHHARARRLARRDRQLLVRAQRIVAGHRRRVRRHAHRHRRRHARGVAQRDRHRRRAAVLRDRRIRQRQRHRRRGVVVRDPAPSCPSPRSPTPSSCRPPSPSRPARPPCPASASA